MKHETIIQNLELVDLTGALIVPSRNDHRRLHGEVFLFGEEEEDK